MNEERPDAADEEHDATRAELEARVAQLDARARRLQRLLDATADLILRYDARGRLTGKLMQPASKKYAEQLTELSYNGRGQVVERKVSHVWPKRPQWSGPRKIERYQYDAAGNLIIVERRVTPRTAVMNRTVFDYSCQPGSSKPRSLPATGCMASYPKCGKP